MIISIHVIYLIDKIVKVTVKHGTKKITDRKHIPIFPETERTTQMIAFFFLILSHGLVS